MSPFLLFWLLSHWSSPTLKMETDNIFRINILHPNKVTLHEIRIFRNINYILQNDVALKIIQSCSATPFSRGAQIPVSRSPWQTDFVRCRQIFVTPQYWSCFLLPFGDWNVDGAAGFLENSCIPHMWSGRNTTYVKSQKTTVFIVRSWGHQISHYILR